MADDSQQIEGVAKTPFFSKTFHFNVWSLVAAYAILPFLPKWITSRQGAEMAIAAWFTLGNMILRYTWGKVLAIDWRHLNAKPPDQPIVVIGNATDSVRVVSPELSNVRMHDGSGNISGGTITVEQSPGDLQARHSVDGQRSNL